MLRRLGRAPLAMMRGFAAAPKPPVIAPSQQCGNDALLEASFQRSRR
jgi:hypothetical protein